jgi:protein O-GlcNAc transferase
MSQTTIQQAFELAMQHYPAGRLREAEILCRQVLDQQPAHFGAVHYLGLVAYQVGKLDIAANLISQAIALNPNSAEAHSNLGDVLRGRGQLNDAIAACRRAIALNPGLAEAHINLGSALMDKGQVNEAIAACRQALALSPDQAEAHSNLGNTLREMGQLDEAIAAYRRAITLRPGFREAHYNLAGALKEKGHIDEAIAVYRQAIAVSPNFSKAHNNLGNILRDKGLLDEAAAAFRQAIAHDSKFPAAWLNLGNTLKDTGQLDEAIAAYRQAIALNPGHAGAGSNLVYTLHYHPGFDARAIAAELARWNCQHAEPLRATVQAHANDRGPDRRLRIGYLSPDFRDHVVGRNLLPLLRRHNREKFEVTCYAQVPRPDAMTGEFQRIAHRWRNIVDLSDEQAAEQIRRDEIDILVDLTLHMSQHRLLVFARKPAPVQATFAGYPGSTGLTAIDFRLSDPYLDPTGMDESVYSERTIRLPDSFWCYDPLDCADILVNPLPALSRGVITFGCLNNFCKVNDGLLTLWANVLRQVKDSRLLLLAPAGDCRLRTLNRLRQEGIDPGRIEFFAYRSRRNYLETYHQIDLGLDTFPYNGHTTSLESFWMGVPVVTLVGSTAVARAGWCQLSNLGLAELAGESPDQFVRLAVELARDLPRLARLRSTLRRRMEQSPLMDATKFTRNIEAAYRRMWQAWCDSAPARS